MTMEKDLYLSGQKNNDEDMELMKFLDLLNERYYGVFRLDLETEEVVPIQIQTKWNLVQDK